MNVSLEGGLKPKSHHQREFDVLSNKYIENHTSREFSDFSKMRDDLTEKYWKNHDFDILAVRYCDSSKQEAFQNELKANEKVHGVKQHEKLPASVKYSEGKVYDIINNQVRNGNAISGIDDKRNKNVASKKTSIIEEQIRTKSTMEDDLLETRVMNRIHPSRYKADRQYGYDPITNVSFNGRNGVEPAPLRQAQQKAVWSKLHQEGNGKFSRGNGDNATAGMKPRDLSGPELVPQYNGIPQLAARSNNNGSIPSARDRSTSGGMVGQSNKSINTTTRPGFVPGLSLPKGGMVDGKLNINDA